MARSPRQNSHAGEECSVQLSPLGNKQRSWRGLGGGSSQNAGHTVLKTVDHNKKIGTLLEDPAYRRLCKDPHPHCQMQDHSSPQKVLLVAEMCQQQCLLGSRSLRFYGVLKFHKEGIPLGNPELLSAIQASKRCDAPLVGNFYTISLYTCCRLNE